METCFAKHTKYQPEENEWACPRCGSTGDFTIAYPDETSHGDCNLLHDRDGIACDSCGMEISGRAYARRVQKAKNLVTCPHCKGVGFVLGK